MSLAAREQVRFGTKAETLERLKPLVKKSTILPLIRFTVREWRSNPDLYLNQIQNAFDSEKLIIRSSSLAEDGFDKSNAGKFKSILGVLSKDSQNIIASIEKVIDSYEKPANLEHQVFIQPFLETVAINGVLFTRDIDTWAPYYVINFDDKSSKTDQVTSGKTNELRTIIKFRDYETKRNEFRKLIAAVEEIEQIFNCDHLDIEFSIDRDETVYIFQVRRLARKIENPPMAEKVGQYLQKIYKKVEKLNRPHPYVCGERTIYGVMPDWNPAEMIGIKPRPLALSLYKELITDKTWAYQRDNYGYKNLRSYPLLVTLIGHAYIDLRVTFNSFIPKDVSDDLSSRLANYYMNSLLSHPESHDKIEFDIVLSCFFFNIDEKLEKLKKAGFSKNDTQELRDALFRLTNNVISQKAGVFSVDLKKIEILKTRQDKVLNSSMTDLEKIYWLVEECRRYGTLPFAGLARAAFISTQILRSLVDISLISKEDSENFMRSLNTVAKQMTRDKRKLNKEQFLDLYGHLRPGTYDILSARYDENYDLYFDQDKTPHVEEKKFSFSQKQIADLDQLLKKEGFGMNAEQLIEFLKKAIEGREYSKFIFTKSVSATLNLIKQLAARYNLNTEDASFLDIKTILQLYATLDHRDLEEIFREEIARNRNFYEITKCIKLPSLIVEPSDIYEFELEEGSPNFVTQKRFQGEAVTEDQLLNQSLEGKIVFIPSADPGYDWIFTKRIGGLITMYGGSNSHMAVRAAELQIPSVIGAGEKNYQRWSKAHILEIDAAGKQVRLIS